MQYNTLKLLYQGFINILEIFFQKISRILEKYTIFPRNSRWNETMHRQEIQLEITHIVCKRILLGGWLGSNADEGRDKLRNVLASGTYTLNQKSLNRTSF